MGLGLNDLFTARVRSTAGGAGWRGSAAEHVAFDDLLRGDSYAAIRSYSWMR